MDIVLNGNLLYSANIVFKSITSKCFIVGIVVFGLLISLRVQAITCNEVFARTPVDIASDPDVASDLSNPLVFAQKMTEGMLLRKGQDELFQFYITYGFSHSTAASVSLSRVLAILQKHPKLSKLPVREQIIDFYNQQHVIPEELKNIIDSFKKTSHQLRSNLFQIEANYGFWIKLLGFPIFKVDSSLSKKEQQIKKNQHKEQFIEYLNTTSLNKHTRDVMKDADISYQDKIFALYIALNSIKNNMVDNGHLKQAQKVSQVMAELVHTVGFSNKSLTEALKNPDDFKNIEIVQKMLMERDTIANDLGYRNFTHLKKKLNANIPAIESVLGNFLKNISQPLESSSTQGFKTEDIRESLRLRVLSIQESPYRSCLAGDCATSIYFEKALDPNHLYFTLTDSDYKSSGQVTVVLGTAKHNNKRWWQKSTKTAFVDKIQNIPINQLVAVLEGIRLSLKEQGYTLALPKAIGDSNGLSNSSYVSQYITHHILPKLQTPLNTFTPHHHLFYHFHNAGHSRANDKLDLLEFTMSNIKDAKITPGVLPVMSFEDSRLSVSDFYNYISSLKYSKNTKDQLNFLKLLLTLPLDKKQVLDHIYSILQNNEASFMVRKHAFYTLIQYIYKKEREIHDFSLTLYFLEENSAFFSDSEKLVIKGEMSNWVNTTDYRKDIIQILTKEYIKTYGSDNNLLPVVQMIDEFPFGFLLANGFLLTHAAGAGDIHSMRFLLEKGVNINAKSYEGENTALVIASARGHIAVVDFLLKTEAVESNK